MFDEDGSVLRPANVRTTLVEPAESAYLSAGTGGAHGVEGVAVTGHLPLLEEDRFDSIRTVPEADARAMARKLARESGVFGGVSTGMNVTAAVSVAADRDEADVVVTVACDTGLKYLAGDLYRPG